MKVWPFTSFILVRQYLIDSSESIPPPVSHSSAMEEEYSVDPALLLEAASDFAHHPGTSLSDFISIYTCICTYSNRIFILNRFSLGYFNSRISHSFSSPCDYQVKLLHPVSRLLPYKLASAYSIICVYPLR